MLVLSGWDCDGSGVKMGVVLAVSIVEFCGSVSPGERRQAWSDGTRNP